MKSNLLSDFPAILARLVPHGVVRIGVQRETARKFMQAGKIHMHFAQVEKRLPDSDNDGSGGIKVQKYEDLEQVMQETQNDSSASNVDTTIVLGGDAPAIAPDKPILCTSLLSFQYSRRP